MLSEVTCWYILKQQHYILIFNFNVEVTNRQEWVFEKFNSIKNHHFLTIMGKKGSIKNGWNLFKSFQFCIRFLVRNVSFSFFIFMRYNTIDVDHMNYLPKADYDYHQIYLPLITTLSTCITIQSQRSFVSTMQFVFAGDASSGKITLPATLAYVL